MSCIVGLIHKGETYIGSDSANMFGSTLSEETEPKVFRKGPLIVGCAGYLAYIQAFRYREWKEYTEDQGGLIPWMLDHVIYPSLAAMEAGDLNIKDKDGDRNLLIDALIGYKDQLYLMAGDGSFSKLAEYAAIGSGAPWATGALFQSRTPSFKEEPKKAAFRATDSVLWALKAANTHCSTVSAPFYVISTGNTDQPEQFVW